MQDHYFVLVPVQIRMVQTGKRPFVKVVTTVKVADPVAVEVETRGGLVVVVVVVVGRGG